MFTFLFLLRKGTRRLGTTLGDLFTGREHNGDKIWWHQAAELVLEGTGVDKKPPFPPLSCPPAPHASREAPRCSSFRNLSLSERMVVQGLWTILVLRSLFWAHCSLIALVFILKEGGAEACLS